VVISLFFNTPFLPADTNPADTALPQNPSTTYGSVGGFVTDVTDPTHPQLNITNVTNGTVINWQGFDIGANATTTFQQESASAWVLNKVVGEEMSATGIFGRLNANGGLIVVNPYGIVFGDQAFVSARAFIASSLNIDPIDFRKFAGAEDGALDTLKFQRGVEDPAGAVINNGTIQALKVYLIGSQVINSGIIGTEGNPASLVVMAAGDKVYLKHDTGSGKVYIEMPSNLLTPDLTYNIVKNEGTLNAPAGQVVLAAGDVFTAAMNVDSLAAKANRDITLNGAVTAAGDISLTADYDRDGVGTMWAKSTIESTGGNVDVWASDSTINLDGDVTAAVDLTLNNNADAADGIALKAGQNVIIEPSVTLTAEGNLEIEATGGKIQAQTSLIKMAADDKTLKLTQNDTLPLSAEFNIENSENADLVATSTDGAITAATAALWKSIEASAWTNVILNDNLSGGNITTNALTAETGNVEVTSGSGQIYANGSISAGSDVLLTARDGINVSGNVGAGQDIMLHNNTVVSDGRELDAGRDVILDDGKTLDGSVSFTLEANRDIILGGPAAAAGDMTLNADADGIDGGDMWVKSTLTTENGSIDISASNTTIKLDDDVSAGWDLLLNNNTVVAADKTLAAYHNIETSGTLYGDNLNLDAGTNIKLRGPSETAAEMTLSAGDSIKAYDSVTSGGLLTAQADWNIEFYGAVESGDGIMIDAGNNIRTYGSLTSGSTLTALADRNIELDGPAQSTGVMMLDAGNNIKAYDSLTSGGLLTAQAGWNIEFWGLVESGDGIMLDAGNNIKAYDSLTSGGLLTALADWNIELGGPAQSTGVMTLNAGNNIRTYGGLTSGSTLTALADWNIELGGPAQSTGVMTLNAGNHIKAYDSVTSGGQMSLTAGERIETMNLRTTNPEDGDIITSSWYYTDVHGNIESAGNLDMTSETDDIEIYDYINVAGDADIHAGGHIELATDTHNKSYVGNDFTANAGSDVEIYGDLEAGDDIYICSDQYDSIWLINDYILAGDSIILGGDTHTAGDIVAGEDVSVYGNLFLIGHEDQYVRAENGTLTAEGWAWKTTPGDLYLFGNNSDPEHRDGKAIDLQFAGCLPAASTCLGNLELYAPNGDIQISGDLTTFGLFCNGGDSDGGPRAVQSTDGDGGGYDRPTGGVSIIAENGKIYTEGATPENDTLNIGIVGNSDDVTWRMYDGDDDVEPLGVDLPYGDGKAAIVVLSSEDLKFGPDTMLIARGTYDSSVVDDRPGVGFLDAPATMAGVVRNEGDPIDVAIYAGSMGTEPGEGNVHLDARAMDVDPGGTMVVDAYDTVTFGDFDTFNLETFDGCKDLGCFLMKLALRFREDIDFEAVYAAFDEYKQQNEGDGEQSYKDLLQNFLNDYFDDGAFFNIDRLEVCSRITEWLYQAAGNGTLPYADNPGVVEAFIKGDYVLRGGGLGNSAITDGRAWVLDNPDRNAPLYSEAGEKEVQQEFAQGGCPALMQWLAGEVGVNPDQIQAAMANAFAYSTNVQPCESCARLKNAAGILADAGGAHIAALGQVVNEFATPGAPIAPEQMTLIASAVSNAATGTRYAAAGEWLDAMAQYVSIMRTELGFSASDSVSFVNKYVNAVTGGGNPALTAYLQARLAQLGS
jgi:filamentous hemagglutinin family protein